VLSDDDARRNAAANVEGETPAPTPRRTPRPTPEATVNLDGLAFQAYLAHVTSVGDELVAGMEQVGADATNLDVPALTSSSIDLWVDLGTEVDWLEANPPEPCFAELHGKWSDAVGTLYEALDQISDGAIYQDPELLDTGTTLMMEGNSLVDDATELTAPAAANCGG
jgi:hypothetical protein